jgi:polar amino acid transport system substrate-binding protein
MDRLKKISETSWIFNFLFFIAITYFNADMQADSNQEDENILRVLISPDNPPFETKDSITGEYKGLDIELTQKIAKKLEKKVIFVESSFSAIFPFLEAGGHVDFAISAISKTKERQEKLDFSIDYFGVTSAFIYVPRESLKTQKIEDIKNLKVGVQLGSVQENYLKKYKEKFPFDIITFSTIPELIENLLSGKIDIILTEENIFVEHTKSNPKLQGNVINMEDAPSFSIVFPKAQIDPKTQKPIESPSVELHRKVDNILEDLKKTGEMDLIIEKYVKKK